MVEFSSVVRDLDRLADQSIGVSLRFRCCSFFRLSCTALLTQVSQTSISSSLAIATSSSVVHPDRARALSFACCLNCGLFSSVRSQSQTQRASSSCRKCSTLDVEHCVIYSSILTLDPHSMMNSPNCYLLC